MPSLQKPYIWTYITLLKPKVVLQCNIIYTEITPIIEYNVTEKPISALKTCHTILGTQELHLDQSM